jgi:hypothetical protein
MKKVCAMILEEKRCQLKQIAFGEGNVALG